MKRLNTYDIRSRTQCPPDLTQMSAVPKYKCSAESIRRSSRHSRHKRTDSSKEAIANGKSDKIDSAESNPSPAGSTAQVNEYVETLERLVASWEQYGHDLYDKQVEHFVTFTRGMQDSFMKGSASKAEAIVKYWESTSIGHEIKDLELVEKVAWSVNYLEKSLEESRLSQAIQKALNNACDRLLDFEELPEPWRENPYIRRGYCFHAGTSDCVRSIFTWHNETANIWTHLLGVISFVSSGSIHLPSTDSWKLGSWMDRLPMIIFMMAALKCMGCSVLWHSFCNISHLKTKRRMACMDYTGITVCICASILTTEYSVLNCHPMARAFYMCVTLACGFFGVVLNWHPMFDTTGARPLRALFFCCFAVFGGLCGIHACFHRGISETLSYYVPVLKSLSCYGTGVSFYATLFPERFFKGFDYCGMSHNVWHAFVVAGIYYHYKAMIEIFGTAVTEVCPI